VEKLPVREIAKALYWSETTIRARLHANGINLRHRQVVKRLDEDDLFRTVELYHQGFTAPQIATILHMAPTGVSWRLKRAGVKMRNGWNSRPICQNGHEYTPENTRYNPKRPTVRVCRECQRQANRRNRLKKEAAIAARS